MVTIEEWTRHFKFQRFPFDRPEAGNEEFSRPEFLASCFVEPENFDRILGRADAPVTTLVFADRGVGKTATRVMMDYYCKHGFVPAGSEPHSRYVLSVPHIHLSNLVMRARALSVEQVQLEHHVIEILRRTVTALTELIASETTVQQSLRQLTPLERLDLAWFMTKYGNLSAVQLGFLQKLRLVLPSDPQEVAAHFELAGEQGLSSQLVVTLFDQRQHSLPLEHLRRLAELIPSIGITATYVAVDGVDEFVESAGNPRVAYEMVRPLLGSLELMDGTPHLALKFFLPAGLQPLVMEDPTVRKDRGFTIATIRWREDDLIQMLRRRLDALRLEAERPRHTMLSGFDLLCVPELHGTIESELSQYADGNPRHLFLLCGLMVIAHCNRESPLQEDPHLLNRYDLDLALSQFQLQATPYRLGVLTPAKLIDLLEQDESEQLEFKASLRWDLDRDVINKALQGSVGKAIAGMLNRHGGILLIGVTDDKQVIGLEKDMQTLGKKNTDGFRLLLNDIVKQYLGIENHQYLQIRFESLEDKTVCIITIHFSFR